MAEYGEWNRKETARLLPCPPAATPPPRGNRLPATRRIETVLDSAGARERSPAARFRWGYFYPNAILSDVVATLPC
jgi:hypothetical protein